MAEERPGKPALDLLESALAESIAARAILLDPGCAPKSAVPHLESGWELIASATDEDFPAPTVDPAATPRRLRRALRKEARRLYLEANAQLRARGKRSRRWLGWVAAIAALSTIAVVMSLGGGEVARVESGWLGRYYSDPNFGGDPSIRYDSSINFDWLQEAPMWDLPSDNFSVRWDTCLVLLESMQVRFELGSDDGSRFFIGDEKLIEMWQAQAGNWGNHTAELPAGRHRLRVEYFEHGGDALAVLRARRVGGGPLPPELFRAPLDVDAEDACAAVE